MPAHLCKQELDGFLLGYKHLLWWCDAPCEPLLRLCRSFLRAGAAGDELRGDALDKLLAVLDAGDTWCFGDPLNCRGIVCVRVILLLARGCLFQGSKELQVFVSLQMPCKARVKHLYCTLSAFYACKCTGDLLNELWTGSL